MLMAMPVCRPEIGSYLAWMRAYGLCCDFEPVNTLHALAPSPEYPGVRGMIFRLILPSLSFLTVVLFPLI